MTTQISFNSSSPLRVPILPYCNSFTLLDTYLARWCYLLAWAGGLDSIHPLAYRCYLRRTETWLNRWLYSDFSVGCHDNSMMSDAIMTSPPANISWTNTTCIQKPLPTYWKGRYKVLQAFFLPPLPLSTIFVFINIKYKEQLVSWENVEIIS